MVTLFEKNDVIIKIKIVDRKFYEMRFNNIIFFEKTNAEFELFALFKTFELFSKNMLEFKDYKYLLCNFEIVRKNKHYYLKVSFSARGNKYIYYFDKLEAGVIAEMFNRYKRITIPTEEA